MTARDCAKKDMPKLKHRLVGKGFCKTFSGFFCQKMLSFQVFGGWHYVWRIGNTTFSKKNWRVCLPAFKNKTPTTRSRGIQQKLSMSVAICSTVDHNLQRNDDLHVCRPVLYSSWCSLLLYSECVTPEVCCDERLANSNLMIDWWLSTHGWSY